MILKLMVLFLLSVKIKSETFYAVDDFYKTDQDKARIRDIYTNYENEEDVLKSYKDLYETSKTGYARKLKNKVSSEQSGEMEYMDRMDFHYPQVEFLTKNEHLELDSDYTEFDKKFTTLNSLTFSDESSYDDRNANPRRYPRLKTSKLNDSLYEYKPVVLSYVQKIPKPNLKKPIQQLHENSRYEEISTGSSEATHHNRTKEAITHLLKKYLNKLYNKKYISDNSNISAVSSEIETIRSVVGTAETKLFNKNLLLANKRKKFNKINKIFSLFTILQFNNTQCNATSATGSYLGVCYTSSECTNLGGTAVGNCASGYGVCCVFTGTCGGTAAQNCSYFQSPNYPDFYPAGGGVIVPTTLAPPTTVNPSPTPDPRWDWYLFNNNPSNKFNIEYGRQSEDTALSCIFSVYKISDDVKKMKIDFLDLELAGPTNGTCIIERLVITGYSTNSIVPVICGYNTGQSIYVDVSQSAGPLKIMVLSTVAYKKKFRVRICQYTDVCLPDNCLQIYNGVTGTISSFNYDQSLMLNRSVPGYFNNLNYAICIQKAPGYCSITYTNVRNGVEYPFNLVNFVNGISTVPLRTAGIDIIDCPNDYIGIDTTRLCGYKFNDGSVTMNLNLNAPVTDTNSGPIVIPVRTNAAAVGYGFKLFYTQNRCPT